MACKEPCSAVVLLLAGLYVAQQAVLQVGLGVVEAQRVMRQRVQTARVATRHRGVRPGRQRGVADLQWGRDI